MNGSRSLFVTGTDTGVGKTRAAGALIRQARNWGVSACGFKPVASGCERDAEGVLRNDDAIALSRASGDAEPYPAINPVALEAAIAPHIAAREAGVRIEAATLDAAHASLATRYPLLIVEGAGGWQVPLNDDISFADWVTAHQWPVLLVVGMRLGCINHALLSAEAILRRAPLAGWIANVLPPEQPRLAETMDSLLTRLPAPLWGVIGAGAEGEAAATALAGPEFRRWLALP